MQKEHNNVDLEQQHEDMVDLQVKRIQEVINLIGNFNHNVILGPEMSSLSDDDKNSLTIESINRQLLGKLALQIEEFTAPDSQ